MKIIHVADIHIGATSEALLDAAKRAIAAQEGDALVVSGDLTQRGSAAEFRGAREWIDELKLPAISVPGNHDTPMLHAGHRLFNPFARYTDHFGDLTRPLQSGKVHLFPLNTSRGWQTRANWAEGSVDLTDLDETLTKERDDGAIPILVCHHPFIPFAGAGLRTRTRRGREASQCLAQSRFRMLMTGHVHTPHVERINEATGSYLAVSAGTLSLRLRNSPPGFNVLDIRDDGVTVSSVCFEEGAFSPLPARQFNWEQEPPAGKDQLAERR